MVLVPVGLGPVTMAPAITGDLLATATTGIRTGAAATGRTAATIGASSAIACMVQNARAYLKRAGCLDGLS